MPKYETYLDDRMLLSRYKDLVCGLVRRELGRMRSMTFADSISEPSVDASVSGTFDVKLRDAFCSDDSDDVYDVVYSATVTSCGRVLIYELSVLPCWLLDDLDLPFPC